MLLDSFLAPAVMADVQGSLSNQSEWTICAVSSKAQESDSKICRANRRNVSHIRLQRRKKLSSSKFKIAIEEECRGAIE